MMENSNKYLQSDRFIALDTNPQQAEIRYGILQVLPEYLERQLKFHDFGKRNLFSPIKRYTEDEINYVTTGLVLQILSNYTLIPKEDGEF